MTDLGWLEALVEMLNGCYLGTSRLGLSVAWPRWYLEPRSTTDQQIPSVVPSTALQDKVGYLAFGCRLSRDSCYCVFGWARAVEQVVNSCTPSRSFSNRVYYSSSSLLKTYGRVAAFG